MKQRVTIHNSDQIVRGTCPATGEIIEGGLANVLRHVSKYMLEPGKRWSGHAWTIEPMRPHAER